MEVEPLLTPEHASASVCVLETVGRRSGQPRQLRIWFAVDGDTVFLLAGDRDSAHWVRNLRANPSARLRVGRRWVEGTAREVEGTRDEARARATMAAKYGLTPGGPFDRWLRTSLPVAIDLSK